jgi:hypothetical protein
VGAKEAPLKVAPGAVKNKIAFPANLSPFAHPAAPQRGL